jgi:hypothetical protein
MEVIRIGFAWRSLLLVILNVRALFFTLLNSVTNQNSRDF